jgi:sulfur carrier protein ThiS
MRIKLFLGGEDSGKGIEIQKVRTIESLLKKMRINPQTVIVKKNGAVVSEQEILREKDTLRIIKVK